MSLRRIPRLRTEEVEIPPLSFNNENMEDLIAEKNAYKAKLENKTTVEFPPVIEACREVLNKTKLFDDFEIKEVEENKYYDFTLYTKELELTDGDDTHTLYGLYPKFTVGLTDDKSQIKEVLNFILARDKVTISEFFSGFIHSHASSPPSGRALGFLMGTRLCLGNSDQPIYKAYKDICFKKADEIKVPFKLFLLVYNRYLRWESRSGGPYRNISRLTSEYVIQSLDGDYTNLHKLFITLFDLSYYQYSYKTKLINGNYAKYNKKRLDLIIEKELYNVHFNGKYFEATITEEAYDLFQIDPNDYNYPTVLYNAESKVFFKSSVTNIESIDKTHLFNGETREFKVIGLANVLDKEIKKTEFKTVPHPSLMNIYNYLLTFYINYLYVNINKS